MRRAEIIVKGKVQSVGYRDIVLDIARDTNITGYVENLKPHNVRIVCEGEENDLERFISLININKYAIHVKDMEVTFLEPMGKYEYFEIRRGEWKEEVGERMDEAVKYLFTNIELSERSVQLGEQSVEIGNQMLGKQDQMLGKQDQMIDKQGQMLGKQDQMLDKQDQMLGKQDQMLGKQDQMLDKQDQMIDKQDQMLGKQEKTIGSIENLRGDVGQRFDVLDVKYGVINNNIQKAIERIDHQIEEGSKDRKLFKTTMEGLLKELIDARKSGTN